MDRLAASSGMALAAGATKQPNRAVGAVPVGPPGPRTRRRGDWIAGCSREPPGASPHWLSLSHCPMWAGPGPGLAHRANQSAPFFPTAWRLGPGAGPCAPAPGQASWFSGAPNQTLPFIFIASQAFDRPMSAPRRSTTAVLWMCMWAVGSHGCCCVEKGKQTRDRKRQRGCVVLKRSPWLRDAR